MTDIVVPPGSHSLQPPHRRRWLIGVGILTLLLGLAGLMMTVAFTIVGTIWYGMLLITAGAVQTVEAIWRPAEGEGRGARLLRALAGVLYMAGGLYAALNPVAASIALTLLLGLVLIASGVARAVWAFIHETRQSRATLILLAVLSVVFGMAILSQWPLSGLWAIGLFVSCDLVATGLAWCWMGLSQSGWVSGPTPTQQDERLETR